MVRAGRSVRYSAKSEKMVVSYCPTCLRAYVIPSRGKYLCSRRHPDVEMEGGGQWSLRVEVNEMYRYPWRIPAKCEERVDKGHGDTSVFLIACDPTRHWQVDPEDPDFDKEDRDWNKEFRHLTTAGVVTKYPQYVLTRVTV